MARLTVFVGPVSSGKSTRACLRAQEVRATGGEVLLVRPLWSVRPPRETPDRLVTRSGLAWPATSVPDAAEACRAWETWSAGIPKGAWPLLWVDEAMLFQDRAAGILEGLVERALVAGQNVQVSTLASTSEGRVFGTLVPRLLALADEIVHCRGTCAYCGVPDSATRSVCLAPKAGDVLVGDQYRPACPACWVKARSGQVAPDDVPTSSGGRSGTGPIAREGADHGRAT